MATVVYQGSQSCLDNSQLVEARMLRLRLFSPKPSFSESLEFAIKCFALGTTTSDQQASSNRDSSCWTFFHSLCNPYQAPKEANNKETPYIHQLAKHSSSRLSEKSLEMCTESLGSETGSDVSGNISLFLSSSSFKEDESLTRSGSNTGSEIPENRFCLSSNSTSKQKSCQISKKADFRGFPPPLTTMNGSGSLHVRPAREDGRLIILAIKSPSTRPCFQSERRNGRLQISLVEDSPVSSSSSEETRDNMSEGSIIKNEQEPHEEMDDVQEQVEDGNDGFFEDNMDTSDLDVEAEMGLDDFRRPSRLMKKAKDC